MVTKRAPAKPKKKADADAGMTKEEACKVLQVAPSADAEIITQAYGFLARKYQSNSSRDRRKRLEELNEAFLVLHPTANGEQLVPETPPGSDEEPISLGEFFQETGQLIARISSRWSGRAPEVIILIVTTAWLGFLALSSGANPLWTLVALAIAGATIWAPWRRASS